MTAAPTDSPQKAAVRRLVDEVMNTAVRRFTCSATHTGEWRGEAPTGRRFENVDEVYFFTFEDGRITDAWGLEDSLERMRQLGIR